MSVGASDSDGRIDCMRRTAKRFRDSVNDFLGEWTYGLSLQTFSKTSVTT